MSTTPFRVTWHVSHVTCHVSHVTCHMSCVTCHVSHVMCHMSCVTYHMSHVRCQVSGCYMSCNMCNLFLLFSTKQLSKSMEGLLPLLVNRPVIVGSIVINSLIHWFIDWLSHPLVRNLWDIVYPKPYELEGWHLEGMFTLHHASLVTGHMSLVTCHVTCVWCQVSHFLFGKGMELVGGGSVINRAYPA